MLSLLQSLLAKHRFLLLGTFALILGAFGLYKWGYSVAQQQYEVEIAKQRILISQLQNAEIKIEKEIVTVYKDRFKTVEKVRDHIIEVTPDVLREESMQCSIGAKFVGLHNAAASNQTVSESSSRVDASTTEAGATSTTSNSH